ncbi:uncharacterized protein DDB_G0284459 [Uranotaenia lowii]|uniref:uncharacterized protein DDB_G0284459 n=1 Tax=Uranotaenia lowii TaxID=190385 RepID=UPI00247A397F|nr:uncharacterized protein DDB_G0284459 [Uranotaenia lowii]
MDSLGSEIGQKMRSAVKAKLIELGTGSASGYIDDELPDYVMIMVANKRSRQQMVDDLNLFLGSQTDVFVSWLHQVLQKLEEVTLPANNAVASSSGEKATKDVTGSKRDGDKKDKKDKKKDKKAKKKGKTSESKDESAREEHTPPHPAQIGAGSIQDVFANQLIQHAKKNLDVDVNATKKDTRQLTPPLRENSNSRMGNEFDIPTISEIAGQSAIQRHRKELEELEEIQQKIKQAKKQLQSMGSEESEDEDFLNIKANDDDLENIESGGVPTITKRKEKRNLAPVEPVVKRHEPKEEEEKSNTPPPPPVASTQKKKSIMERLGTRPEPAPKSAPENVPEESSKKSTIISLSAHRREERELYVPIFRRKEMEEQAKAREARSRVNRSRSRERDRRRSSPPPSLSRTTTARRESSRERSRSRRDRDRARERDRTRSRERLRERDRDKTRDRSTGRTTNGADVRTRIGSRVYVLPSKPEYKEEDELEVPIPSVVKIQPRPQVPKSKQPSKNLLLKAMAEAQRSTAANLKKTINNRDDSSTRPRRMLIEIPGGKSEGTPPVDVRYEFEDDEEDEVDIVTQVLGVDDEDDELQKILNSNDEYIPEPVAVSISNHSVASDSDSYVYVPSKKHTDQSDVDEYDPKFVVTLDGAYKKVSRSSPSHTPPPPTAKSKPSIKDRIGSKVASSEGSATPPQAQEGDDQEHKETLKRRKERFSLRAPTKENKNTDSKSPEKRSKSSKKSPVKRESTQQEHNAKPSKRSTSNLSAFRNKSPPPDLNELLMQRTKELLVDDSVSSSPIYMSKSDYEKIEPNSSSRKRKRVSPIQFELTDDDEAEDSDGDVYNHHRDRTHRERRSPVERRAPISMDDDEGGSDHRSNNNNNNRKDRRSKERESERRFGKEDFRRKEGNSAGANSGNVGTSSENKSPSKKIKKLESSRKFDDVPSLLSSVSVPTDNLSKSKAIIKERCKYFPLCRQGDSCEFLHPNTNCKAFPGCKFGDKCLYLHPMCKYDKTCVRMDCNYMHSKPMAGHPGYVAPPLASSVVPVQNYKSISAKPLPALCRFYPGCTNGLCPYYHPKMCRFGRNCMNKVECNFYHQDIPAGGVSDYHEVPSKDKFKWISPFSA